MMKRIALLFLVLLGFLLVACDSGSKVEYPKEYGVVDVISAEETKTGYTFTLETDGFSSTTKIKAEVTIVDGKITAYTVVSNGESTGYGKTLIEDGIILQAIIDETDNLDDFDVTDYLDSEASATITADALLEIALAALEHYNEDYK
ncbi:MAG: FMN-binding protein [Acholeplasma sp.]|nr:FMN-binding protein [Acholeplasma sp.]